VYKPQQDKGRGSKASLSNWKKKKQYHIAAMSNRSLKKTQREKEKSTTPQKKSREVSMFKNKFNGLDGTKQNRGLAVSSRQMCPFG